jgi:demethylmenaquinone methyltransferase / 2-methoxy-6-polyprenyl-1,4-benzoquinol methylase
MAETFFESGEGRAAGVRRLFSRIAPRYDLINDIQSFGLHRYWKRRLIRLTGLSPGRTALDVCCGTGDLAFALARRGARVVGLDFSPAMLKIAEQRKGSATELRTEMASAPGFLLGDARRLAFGDNSFDVVTIGYGLRNLPDWQAGLDEMRRVATPGGRLLVLEFGKPDNAIWRACYFGYLKLFVPVLGLLFCGSAAAYAYILESLEHFPAQSKVADRLREIGLKNVRVINLLGGAMSILYAEKPVRA